MNKCDNEILNYYDEEGNNIGKAERSEIHLKGLWHKTFQCWIIKKEEQEYYLLFQKRHPKKDTNPNLYDISSAGHLQHDEDTKDGIRELKEELGIDASFKKLISLGVIKNVTRYKEYIDKEFNLLYLYISNKPLQEYTLQLEELTSLVKIQLNDILKLFNEDIYEVLAEGIEYDEHGKCNPVEKYLKLNDFVPHGYEYYNYVFSKIEEALKGL